jgi:AraC-like DNA-binding protein
MTVTEVRIRPPAADLLHQTWRPAAGDPLAPFVEAIAYCDGALYHPRERLFPSGTLELVVHLADHYRVPTPRGPAPLPSVCVSGILSGPVVMHTPAGHCRVVTVRLWPAGARAVIRCPLWELSGQMVELRDVIPGDAASLVHYCQDERSGRACIAIVRQWLAARLDTVGSRAGAVSWAVSEIVRHHGALAIDTLRDRTGLSWARLAADFRDQVGVTPKYYARLVRFRRAIELAHASPGPSLSSLALEAGYYDQAHMNAEFRALGGLTPGEFRSSIRYPDAVTIAEGTSESLTHHRAS